MAQDPCEQKNCRDLDGDLGWALGVVFRAYAKATRAAMADVPGGPRAFQVLVAAAGDQHGNQLAVARRLGIDRTVMTYLLDDLERAGVLHRTPDPNDRRARCLVVTPAGLQLLEDLQRRLATIEDHLLACLDDDERQVLRSGLRRIALRLDEADPVTDRCTLMRELET